MTLNHSKSIKAVVSLLCISFLVYMHSRDPTVLIDLL